jgi:hypothetical protein
MQFQFVVPQRRADVVLQRALFRIWRRITGSKKPMLPGRSALAR